ncbi:MAG: P1 family peptidase [Pseudomonadota bacterium]
MTDQRHMRSQRAVFALAAVAAALAILGAARAADRARDLGVPFDGDPGPLNAITDVAGVSVGHVSLTRGRARTGATAVFPRDKAAADGVAAGYFAFNGTGELTGAHFIEEFGAFFGPVVLTGTLGVGAARDGILQWTKDEIADADARFSRILPVVGETYDGALSDAWSFPLKPGHVVEALRKARPGPVEEGAVGGGVGMVAYEFKGGIGTASRAVRFDAQTTYTVGVLVQTNHGRRSQLRVAGAPVGRMIADLRPVGAPAASAEGDGSIIVLIATDAPLLPSQLKRLARRATVGMARTGGEGSSLSGDIFLAFSTANPVALGARAHQATSLPGEALDPLIAGVVQATE